VFDFKKAIDDVMTVMRHQADIKGLSLTAMYPDEFPKKLYADQTRIKQVVLNFITNALKFTK